MRTSPLGPSVELPMGPRSAVLTGGNACEQRHWGVRWSSLWRHEALYWVGEMHEKEILMGPRNVALDGGNACGGHRHWSCRWSSVWRHEA
eukprot:4437923-Pyramimonas_sp.AAC.1